LLSFIINSIFSLEVIDDIKEEIMKRYLFFIILGVLGLGLVLPVQAASVVAQPPLIFEYNLDSPATVEPKPILTNGIIKSIAISAETTGEVNFEVSANGGIAYTKIANGQVLGDGFIPGNQLRFRATIAADSVLRKVVLGYTDSSGASKLFNNPDLANYKKHQEIDVIGGSQNLFNYPLLVKVNRSDIYFTASDGQTPLYYYLEDKENCYVKVLQIPQEGTKIYMYYNEVIASPAGTKQSQKEIVSKYLDGEKVFLFFDDFNAPLLTPEKWETIAGVNKESLIKDGYLQLKDCLVLSRNFKIKQGVLEYKAKAAENAAIQVTLRSKVSAQTLFPYEQIVYSSNYPGAEHTIAINNIAKLNVSKPIQPLTDYIYKATINASGILFERFSQDRQEKQAQIQFFDSGNQNAGYIGLKSDAAFNAGSVYFDWVRVRPYVETEPVAEVIK